MEFVYFLAFVIIVWALLCSKSSRFDGTLIKKVHPYRILMGYIYPSRDASVVYFDADVNADNLLKYLESDFVKKHHAGITHLIVYAAKLAIEQHPEMNTFFSGRRFYKRNGVHISFTVKRSLKEKKSKLSVLKMNMSKISSFTEFCKKVNSSIEIKRSGKDTNADKEYNLLTSLPRFLLEPLIKFVIFLDFFNLLPAFFIKSDGFFSSLIVTNLGSLKMDPAYHHLYEWGNCPLFLMAGQITQKAVVVDGKVVSRNILPLRIAYDERIDDGMTASQGLNKLVEILQAAPDFIKE